MTLTAIALLNGALVLLITAALALAISLGLRVHRVSNTGSLVPAEPTAPTLHDEQLARAA